MADGMRPESLAPAGPKNVEPGFEPGDILESVFPILEPEFRDPLHIILEALSSDPDADPPSSLWLSSPSVLACCLASGTPLLLRESDIPRALFSMERRPGLAGSCASLVLVGSVGAETEVGARRLARLGALAERGVVQRIRLHRSVHSSLDPLVPLGPALQSLALKPRDEGAAHLLPALTRLTRLELTLSMVISDSIMYEWEFSGDKVIESLASLGASLQDLDVTINGRPWDRFGDAIRGAAPSLTRLTRLVVQDPSDSEPGWADALSHFPRLASLELKTVGCSSQSPSLILSALAALQPPGLRTLSLRQPFKAEWASFLPLLSKISKLELTEAPLDAVRFVAAMPDLSDLTLWNASDDSLAPLSGLRPLRRLSLSGPTTAVDGGLAALRPLPRLEHLSVSSAALTTASLPHLAPLAASLRGLQLANCASLAPGALQHLAELTSLSRLALIGCEGVAAGPWEAWGQLSVLRHLKVLGLMGTVFPSGGEPEEEGPGAQLQGPVGTGAEMPMGLLASLLPRVRLNWTDVDV